MPRRTWRELFKFERNPNGTMTLRHSPDVADWELQSGYKIHHGRREWKDGDPTVVIPRRYHQDNWRQPTIRFVEFDDPIAAVQFKLTFV